MSETLPSVKHNWLAVATTVLVLGLLVVFAWRVIYWARLIQSGELTDPTTAFLTAYSPSALAEGRPLPTGTFDVTGPDDPSLGSETAKVTIVEFADFGCPFSRDASTVVRSLAKKYGDQVRFIYRDFPIDELHPEARRAAEAAECASEQDRFWEYHDKLYQRQSDLSEERLVQFASELNLNVHAFETCLKSGRYAQEVAQDEQDGLDAGVAGTPTFFINGNRIPGAIPEDIFDSLIQRALNS